MNAARLSIYSLGPFEVEVSGRPSPGVSGGKMSALLMLLAMRPGHRYSREDLADMLWPGLPIQPARNNLRHTFFHLREALGDGGGEPYLLFGRDWLSFNDQSDHWLDARELAEVEPKRLNLEHDSAKAERAVALYRGELMAGFSLPDCQGFERWLRGRREDLGRRAVSLLEHLVRHHEANGGYERCLEFARRLLALDPLNESFHRQVMRLCASSGRPAAARAQYDACQAALWRELGIRPSAQTAALQRQILEAETQSQEPAGGAQASPPLPALPRDRRQVTVLYGELRLVGIEDIDEAAEQLRGPQRRCADILRSHGGYISQAHGGGLLAYFGYPEAQEGAARRAVTAALAMCRAAAPAVVRCGVHTGVIATAPGLRAPDLAGKTSELAIQLRLAAGEQGIALSQEAYRLVEGHVLCAPLGSQELIPGARPVEAYRVEGAVVAARRPAAALSPFVGRAKEIRFLSAIWRRACAGNPAVVLVRGDPGIGKTRLVEEVRRRVIAQADHAAVGSFCLPEHQGTPFFPFTGFLQAAAPPASSGSPQEAAEDQRRRLMAAMLDAVLEPARWRPLLVQVEDLQWADSSSLELLRQLVERLKSERVLVLLTGRPEFGPPRWLSSGAFTLELEHLPEKPARQLAESLSSGLPPEQLQRIVAQADGVPLFIEELARWQGGRKDRAQSNVPTTLHDLLMARIEQLGSARRLAQVGASCGREFEPKVLAAALKEDGVDVERGIQDLLRSGLVLEGKGRLRFKHALIQEAAYESQSRGLRRETHGRIAAILERDFQNRCRNRPETLAHHLTEAREIEPAIRWWRAAGATAARCWSHHEAVLHLRKALELMAEWTPSRERDKQELSLRVALGPQLLATTGFGSPEMQECYDGAYALCRESDDAEQLFHVIHGQYIGAGTYASYAYAAELAARLERLAQMSKRAEFALAAHVAWVAAHFWMGKYAEVEGHAEAACALCPDIDVDAHVRAFGVDPEVYSLVFLGLSRWYLGRPDEANRLAQAAMAAAEKSSHAGGKCAALNMMAILERFRRRPQEVLEHSEALGTLSEKHGIPLWSAAAKSLRGWAWAMQGNAEGVAQSLQGLEEIRKNFAGAEIMFGVVYLEAAAVSGRNEQALSEVDALLEAARRRCDGHATPELHRLKGEALMAICSENRGDAEACLREALELARQSGARMLELRAAASLFRLKRDKESRELLARLAAWFEEGADHPDVLDARRLAVDGSLS